MKPICLNGFVMGLGAAQRTFLPLHGVSRVASWFGTIGCIESPFNSHRFSRLQKLDSQGARIWPGEGGSVEA